jgi:hypothetical protein
MRISFSYRQALRLFCHIVRVQVLVHNLDPSI